MIKMQVNYTHKLRLVISISIDVEIISIKKRFIILV